MNIAEIKVSYSNTNTSQFKITSSQQAYKLLKSCWNIDTIELQEEFKVLMLNNNNQILGVYPLSKGGTRSTSVDLSLIHI